MKNNIFRKIKSYLSVIKKVAREKGVYYVIVFVIKNRLILHFYYKLFKSSKSFTFQGQNYNYFYHWYNTTWANERIVEIPIVWEMMKKYQGKKILEVGNVISYYFPVDHDVLDKYEKIDGVINQDIADFKPAQKYDLIISISTLEHVGWNENFQDLTKVLHDSAKILKAIQNLKNLLTPEGKMIVTIPVGYNPLMDRLLCEGKIQFQKLYCLKRISADNKWQEVSWQDIRQAKYGHPFPAASGLLIGVVQN